MNLRFSRHAKNNMRLYGITAAEIELVLMAPEKRSQEGEYLIAYRQFFRRFGGFPLKVVYVIEDDAVIVSVYPLKRSYRR